jgi:hypothetical protein
MKLTIEATDVNGLKFQLIELAQGFGLSLSPSLELVISPEATKEPEAKEPKKRAKKASPPPLQEAVEEKEEEVVAPASSSDLKEQALSSLKKINSVKGVLVAKKILEEFNCARISELKTEDMPRFIATCEAMAQPVA